MRKLKIVISFILVLSVLSLVACGGDSSSSSSSLPKVGSSITLGDNFTFCNSKDNVDKMIDFVREKNKDGQGNMFLKGEAVNLTKGTKINIVKYHTAIVEIETSDGEKLFAPVEVVKK